MAYPKRAPRAAKKKYVPKKKVYKRKRVFGPKFSLSTSNVIPPKMFKTLTYCSYVVRQPVAGIVSSYCFRANSVYDPDQTSTGHQPLGHDQLATLYANTCVHASRIRAKVFTPVHPSGNVPMYVGIDVVDNPSIVSNLQQRLEARRGRGIKLLTSDADDRVNVSSRVSTKKFFGVKNVRDDNTLSSAIGVLPAKEIYYMVWVQPADQSSSAIEDIAFEVIIEYDVEWFNPIQLTAS